MKSGDKRGLRIKGHRRLRNRGGGKPPPAASLSRHGSGKQRISKIMAHRGICSRREAERLIDAGQVLLEGEVVRQQGVKAASDARIELLDGGQRWLREQYTILFNKPRGVLCRQYEDEAGTEAWSLLRPDNGQGPQELMQLIADRPHTLHVAGRLDKDSQGLLVMTQNGRLVRTLTQGARVDKEYEVHCQRAITTDDLDKLAQPIYFDGQEIKPMRISRSGPRSLRFVLREGRKHQIRLVCRALGLRVKDLVRIRIGPWRLDDLQAGHWRAVEAASVQRLISGNQLQ